MPFKKNRDCCRREEGDRHGWKPRGRQVAWALACLCAAVILLGAAHPTQSAQNSAPGGDGTNPAAQAKDPPAVSAQAPAVDEKTANPGGAHAVSSNGPLAEDSAKLVKLASDLKAEVDKTNKDMLDLRVIRKADEIERLAHSVREKMKLTVAAN